MGTVDWLNWYNGLGAAVAAVVLVGVVWKFVQVTRRFLEMAKVLIGEKGGGGVRAVKPLVDIVDEDHDLLAAHMADDTRTQEFILAQLHDIQGKITGTNGKTLVEMVEEDHATIAELKGRA